MSEMTNEEIKKEESEYNADSIEMYIEANFGITISVIRMTVLACIT